MHPSSTHRLCVLLASALVAVSGCHVIPIHGTIHTDADATVQGAFQAKVDVHMPTTSDAGPVVASVVRPGAQGASSPRVAVIDVDGLLLNQNLTGLYSVGENPVAAFREKLEAAACDPRVRAVVVRINSPGGGVTATDILAEDLRRFRAQTGKPAVACLMDLATGGAYYLAVGCDVIVAHPTTITGGVGCIANHFNLEDAASQLNVRSDPIKAGDLVDMGSVMGQLTGEPRQLLQAMVDSFRDRFVARVTQRRPAMTPADRRSISDGRVVTAPQALALHLVDHVGYVDDALAEADRLAGSSGGSEVILYQRAGNPAHSIYSITPNVPIQTDLIPFSYPGLDRTKLPTFLYLWQPDPTVTRLGGRRTSTRSRGPQVTRLGRLPDFFYQRPLTAKDWLRFATSPLAGQAINPWMDSCVRECKTTFTSWVCNGAPWLPADDLAVPRIGRRLCGQPEEANDFSKSLRFRASGARSGPGQARPGRLLYPIPWPPRKPPAHCAGRGSIDWRSLSHDTPRVGPASARVSSTTIPAGGRHESSEGCCWGVSRNPACGTAVFQR